jgi:LysM repeat protein
VGRWLLAYDLGQGKDQELGIEINHPVAAAASPSYIVMPGNTLGAIARAQHVSLQRLIAANPQIKNPSRIATGQRLSIPA